MEDSGEALKITGESISEEEVAENPVLNFYGSPITTRTTELNRISDRREPVARSSRSESDDVDRVVRTDRHHLQSFQFFLFVLALRSPMRLICCGFAEGKTHVVERERRGPCQNANSKCSSRSQCGTSKAACKNRAVEVQPVNRNHSAFARRRRNVEESENEIKVNITLYRVHEKRLQCTGDTFWHLLRR